MKSTAKNESLITMTTDNKQFLKEDVEKIVNADDLKIAPFREDGKTYGTPTWIWAVAVDGDLYVRAYNGVNSRWYMAAMLQKAGRIIAAGMIKEVRFEPVQEDMKAAINEAYKKKYTKSPYLSEMISNRASTATVKIIPI